MENEYTDQNTPLQDKETHGNRPQRDRDAEGTAASPEKRHVVDSSESECCEHVQGSDTGTVQEEEVKKREYERILRIIGNNIRRVRKEKQLTLEKLAEQAHLSDKYLQRVEVGKKNISVIKLYQVARVLDVPMTELVQAPAVTSYDKSDGHEDIRLQANYGKLIRISEQLKSFSMRQIEIIGTIIESLVDSETLEETIANTISIAEGRDGRNSNEDD